MLLHHSEMTLFLTVAGSGLLDASKSFELSRKAVAHQDAATQEFEEYWLPCKN